MGRTEQCSTHTSASGCGGRRTATMYYSWCFIHCNEAFFFKTGYVRRKKPMLCYFYNDLAYISKNNFGVNFPFKFYMFLSFIFTEKYA